MSGQLSSDVPTTCRAAVLEAFGEPLVVRDVKVPQQLEHGALLVKVEAASMCGTDIHLWQNELPGQFPLPIIPGHEMMGTVAAVPDEVTVDSVGDEIHLGDRLVWTHGSCGHCFYCTVEVEPACCSNRRIYMQGNADTFPYLTGGFAEYAYVFPESGRIRVPSDVKDEWASQASCALRTMIHAFDRAGRIEPHQTVLVQGTGPLGLYATALAHHSGSERIIAIGGPTERLDLAKKFGASDIISIDEVGQPRDRIRAIREVTDGQGADIAFECSGAEGAFAEGMAMVRTMGRYMIVGQVGSHWTSVQPGRIVHRQLDIRGSLSGHTEHFWKAMRFLASTRSVYDWDAMTTDEFSLDEINDAYASMQSQQTIKPVIRP